MRLSRHGSGTGFPAGRILLASAALLGVAILLGRLGSSIQSSPAAATAAQSKGFGSDAVHGPATSGQILNSYRHLPLIFEANQGQTDPRVKFVARGGGYKLFLTADEAVLAVGQTPSTGTVSVVRMAVAGADPHTQVSGTKPLPGTSNYLIGNAPAKWYRGIPQFAQVRYEQVYPGIDLVYYGKQGELEYDFEVAAGADPRQVRLRFQGPEKLTLDANGDLLLVTHGGEVRLQAPRVYQRIGTEPRVVPGSFVLRPGNEVGFEIGPYDRTQSLVIDPVLSYSTYLGGTADEACSIITGKITPGCPAIAVDAASNAYIAGSTTSIDFPVTSGVVQSTSAGAADVFIAKFNLKGNALLFATYLGGSGLDSSAGIAVDSGFDVFVAGTTASADFPTDGTIEAFQATPKTAGTHAFVSELNSSGTTLLYSTYISGSSTDIAKGLALDVKSKAYVMGTTTSTDFPTTAGAFQTASKAQNQFFMSKIDPTLAGASGLAYSTYLGGSTPSSGVTDGGGIAVDTSTTANVFVTGGTTFTDMPVLNAAQGTVAGGEDAFVAKFTPTNASGTQQVYLTYAGGNGTDIGNGVAVDSGGNAYITGSTTSTDIQAVSGTTPFQANYAGGGDGFVFKLNNPAAGSSVAFSYFSYIGGTGDDAAQAIAVDTSQGARITGYTDSTDFPTVNPTQAATGGARDGFVARVDTASTAHFSTYLGGAVNDIGTAIAIDPSSATYVTGETTSGNFPVVTPFQSALSGTSDAFVTKFGPVVNLAFSPAPTVSPSPAGIGNEVTFTYKILNNGDLTTGINFTDTLPASGTTFVSATSSPGSCGSPTGSPPTVTCSLGALAANATGTVTIIVTPTVPGNLGNSGVVSVVGSSFTASDSASTTVDDFNLGVAPASATVVAGAPASYTLTVTPSPSPFPNSISLSCSSGLPSAATCAFSTNPLPNANNGPVTSALTINTTIRPVPTGWLEGVSRLIYATWLPVGGVALIGLRIGGTTRRRRILGGLLTGSMIGIVLFLVACGSSSAPSVTTGGTPAGTYPITVTATSGSATRTTTLTLVVQ